MKILPRGILVDAGFEAGQDSPAWRFTTTSTLASHQNLVQSGLSPRPFDGNYQLQLGGLPNITDRAEQELILPPDMTDGGISLYFSVHAGSKNGQNTDTLSATLAALDGSGSVLVLSTSSSSGSVDYSLASASIPASLAGRRCRLSLQGVVNGSGPSTFYVDGIGVWVRSQSLAATTPPPVRLALDTSLSGCNSKHVVAFSGGATNLTIRRLDRTAIASCSACTSLAATASVPAGGSLRLVAEGSSAVALQTSNLLTLGPGGGALCTSDTQPPSAAITSVAPNAELRGTILVSARSRDNVGVRETTIQLDGAIVQSVFGDQADWIWDTTKSTPGLHRLSAFSVDVSGHRSALAGSTDFPVQITTGTCTGSNGCSDKGVWSDPKIPQSIPTSTFDSLSKCATDIGLVTGTPPKSVVDCAKQAVGFLSPLPSALYCSGVLIGMGSSAASFLTGKHCVTANDVSTTFVNFTEAGTGKTVPVISIESYGGTPATPSNAPLPQDYYAHPDDDWAILKIRKTWTDPNNSTNVNDISSLVPMNVSSPINSTKVFALGYPGGLPQQISYLTEDKLHNYAAGVIESADKGSTTTLSLGHGNSGGPVFDYANHVVGIVSTEDNLSL